MRSIEELEIRAAFQIALLGMISQDIRSISFEYLPSKGLLKFRANFAAPPHEMALENMSCVLTEVEAGISSLFSKIEEEYVVIPPPAKPTDLSKILYVRCESPDFLPRPNKAFKHVRFAHWDARTARPLISR